MTLVGGRRDERRAHAVERGWLRHRKQRLNPRHQLRGKTQRENVVDAAWRRASWGNSGSRRLLPITTRRDGPPSRLQSHPFHFGLEVDESGLEVGRRDDVMQSQLGCKFSQMISEGKVDHVAKSIRRFSRI